MDLWVLTGYVAHAVLTAYWFWVVASTAPQLRRGTRDRHVRMRVLLLKTAALALTALLVAIIHYWATAWWQVAVALPIALGLGVLLRRAYRRTVAAPRHRLTIARRARTLDLHRRPRGGHAPAHLRVEEPAPRVTARLAD
jgi:cation transport ATPase